MLQRIAGLVLNKADVYITVGETPKGLAVESVQEYPVYEYDNRDFDKLERAVAAGEEVTDKKWHPIYMAALRTDRRERIEKLVKAAQRKRQIQKYVGKSLDEVLAWAQKDDDEDDGQAMPYAYHIYHLEYAVEAGVSGAKEKLAEYVAMQKDWEKRAAEAAASWKKEREAREAAQDTVKDEVMAIIDKVAKENPQHAKYAQDAKDNWRVGASMLLHDPDNGRDKAAKWARELMAAAYQRNDTYTPETFGYCHGTDFEGSTW